MKKFMVQYMGYGGALKGKDEYLEVREDELENGLYIGDETYMEVGEIVRESDYEDGLKVVELETGRRLAIVDRETGWRQVVPLVRQRAAGEEDELS